MLFLAKIKKIFYWIEKIILKIPIIRKYLYLRQLSKFIIAGGIVTLLDFAIYFFLTRFFDFWDNHFLWANFIAMSVGAIASYIINKNWVFKDKRKALISHYIKFWIFAGAGGMLFYQLIFYFLTTSLNLFDILSKIITALIVVFLRFIIQKFWIFK